MLPIAAPLVSYTPEVWADSDFVLPDDDDAIVPHSDREDADELDEDPVEDWDKEFEAEGPSGSLTRQSLISPPLYPPDFALPDEGDVSTIKASGPLALSNNPKLEEDLEAAFALPSDLSQLSLKPLQHRPSKSSIEWGERDNTASSSSTTSLSETYSSLGLAHGTSPSSVSTHSRAGSHPDTENDDEDIEGDLDGLILPSSLFESRQAGKELTRILDVKKKLPVLGESLRLGTEEGDTDFETGLVIDDDVQLSPSRLLLNRQQAKKEREAKGLVRSHSTPAQSSKNLSLIPHFRSSDSSRSHPRIRSKSPIALPSRPTSRSGSVSPSSTHLTPSTSTSQPRSTALRIQKSTQGFRPTSKQKLLTRKTSLSSLMDESSHVSTSTSTVPNAVNPIPQSYISSTAASRARAQQSLAYTKPALSSRTPGAFSTLRTTSPSFDTSISQRLTLPSSLSRTKVRPALSSVFANASFASGGSSPPFHQSSSFISNEPQTMPNAVGNSFDSHVLSAATATKVMRKPKRPRLYGDGTELDAIEDLPTDREKESRYHITPKTPTARIPGASYPATMLRGPATWKSSSKHKELGPGSGTEPGKVRTSTRRKGTRLPETKSTSTPTRRKPTLIRNLSGAGAPKVVGEMRWNPEILRWEGNEHILRDFDAVTATSTRPALITHLTGSSMGSPVLGFAAGARVVGNMIFDPIKMCWLSRLPPEEDEPDVFAGLEDDDSWESRSGTVRASQRQKISSTVPEEPVGEGYRRPLETPRSSAEHARYSFNSGSEGEHSRRGSLIHSEQVDMGMDEGFVEQCQDAEANHAEEMAGWILARPLSRQRLYYIRELATQSSLRT